jgi:DNA-binding transcriptional MerR regulator
MRMDIDKVSQLTGISPLRIQLYEIHGLIMPSARLDGSRLYGDDEIRALALIQQAHDAGVTLLEEPREFIDCVLLNNGITPVSSDECCEAGSSTTRRLGSM